MMSSRTVCFVAGLLLSGSALGEFKPDPGAMVKELEIASTSDDRVTLVLWLPTEFWRASLESSGKIAPQEIARFTRELEPYVIVAVADGQKGIAGAVNFAEPDLLKNAVTIEDARGERLAALPDEEISGGVRNLTQMMRPVFSNMLGSLGVHLAFVVFPGTEKAGRRTVEPTKEGTFVVHVGTVAAPYRLPLVSLLPPVIDEKTGESFPGNYRFNPFTGNKLSPAPAAGAKPPADFAPARGAPSAPTGTGLRLERPAPAPGIT
jgi:hypothetical protein